MPNENDFITNAKTSFPISPTHHIEYFTEQDCEPVPRSSKQPFQGVYVRRAIDGDTIELANRKRVRLIGINTPESTYKIETYGKEARDYTEEKLAGRAIWLQRDVSQYDRYGRLLRYVWLEVPWDQNMEAETRIKMFNAHLILYGYAELSTFPPDVAYSSYFRQFAQEARRNKAGLWKFEGKDNTLFSY
jgi:micrococcal nuclease